MKIHSENIKIMTKTTDFDGDGPDGLLENDFFFVWGHFWLESAFLSLSVAFVLQELIFNNDNMGQLIRLEKETVPTTPIDNIFSRGEINMKQYESLSPKFLQNSIPCL